jgi:SEC-C motif-containing protein
MRSRYTAYASGDVAHVMRTTHPDGPHFEPDARAWAESLRRYCAAVAFEGLEVRAASEAGAHGSVTFHARLRHGTADHSFAERSSFVRVGERWLYLDGERLEG